MKLNEKPEPSIVAGKNPHRPLTAPLDPLLPKIPQILKRKGFKPLEGDFVDVLKESIRAKLKVSISERELDDAVASLGAFAEPEIMMMLRMADSYCIKCGDCCRTQSPINMRSIELKRIAKHLGIKRRKLTKLLRPKHRKETGTFDIAAKPCPLLDGNDCTVYPVRPFVCKMYPFGHAVNAWLSNAIVSDINSSCHAVIESLAFVGSARIAFDLMLKEPNAAELVAELKHLHNNKRR